MSLEWLLVSTFWLGSDTSLTFCPVIIWIWTWSYEYEYVHIIWTWETKLTNCKMLISRCRTDICSWKLSAKVSLMLDNPFLVLWKLNHISVCFIQISTKSPESSSFPSGKAMFFLKPSPVFWAARKNFNITKISIKTARVCRPPVSYDYDFSKILPVYNFQLPEKSKPVKNLNNIQREVVLAHTENLSIRERNWISLSC